MNRLSFWRRIESVSGGLRMVGEESHALKEPINCLHPFGEGRMMFANLDSVGVYVYCTRQTSSSQG